MKVGEGPRIPSTDPLGGGEGEAGSRDALWSEEGEGGLGEERLAGPEACLERPAGTDEGRGRKAPGGNLRMEVEGAPGHRGSVAPLEVIGPVQAQVAPGSEVVRPDRDLHAAHANAEWRPRASPPRRRNSWG